MKKNILKKVVVLKAVPLNIRKFNEMDKSVFIEFPNTQEGTIVNIDNDIGNLAFEDIMVLRDSSFNDRIVKDGVILHIFRLSSDAIGIGVLMLEASLQKYVLVTAYEFNHRTMSNKIIWTPASYKVQAEEAEEYCLTDALHILAVLRNYERTAKPANLPHSIMKLPKPIRDTYVEYTLDLSKPIIASGVSGGGSHASPREHLRRGHYRTRNGVRYFVRSTIVNEGAKAKVVKEYKV